MKRAAVEAKIVAAIAVAAVLIGGIYFALRNNSASNPTPQKSVASSRAAAPRNPISEKNAGKTTEAHSLEKESNAAGEARVVLAPGRAAIEGIVTRADGRPVKGVSISVMIGESQKTSERQSLNTKTDDEGRFILGDLMPGKCFVGARMKGDRSTSGIENEVNTTVTLEKDVTTKVGLIFPGPRIVKGRTINAATGNGIAGVRISPFAFYDVYGGEGKRSATAFGNSVTSDVSGYFQISLLTGKRFTLNCEIAGWMPLTEQRSITYFELRPEDIDKENSVTLRFTRANLLKGIVLDADGAPVSDVAITVSNPDGARDSAAATNKEGTFQINISGAGNVHVTALCAKGWDEKNTVIPSEEELRMTLQPFATVSGNVSYNTGKPVPGCTVKVVYGTDLRADLSSFSRGIESDENGNYYRDLLKAGKVSILLAPPKGSMFQAPPPLVLNLAAGDRKEHQDFVLGAGDTIVCTVTDESHEPLAGVHMAWTPSVRGDDFIRSEIIRGDTDERGRFRIEGLAEGDVVRDIFVDHPDYISQQRSAVTALDGPQNFVLKKREEITLVITDGETGNPVPHYSYTIADQALNMGATAKVNNEAGEAKITFSSARSQIIHVYETDDAGNGTGRQKTSSSDKVVGNRLAVALDKGRSVKGKVLDKKTGSPVEGADVKIGDTQMFLDLLGAGATTNPAGEFGFDTLYNSRYTLHARKDRLEGSVNLEMALQSADQWNNLVIYLDSPPSVHGRVIGKDGKPVIGTSVSYNAGMHIDNSSVTDEQGNYRFDNVRARGFMLHVKPPYSEMEGRMVEPKAGEDLEVDFDFSELIYVTGSITINGRPLSGYTDRLYFAPVGNVSEQCYVRPGAEGSYKCQVKPGSYRLKFGDGLLNVELDSFEVPASPQDQTRDFNINFATADVVIDVEEGTPFQPGSISIHRAGEDGTPLMQLRAGETRKILPRIPPGVFVASFRSNDGSTTGKSDPLNVSIGGENVFYISVHR